MQKSNQRLALSESGRWPLETPTTAHQSESFFVLIKAELAVLAELEAISEAHFASRFICITLWSSWLQVTLSLYLAG
jgi:hypothetical protein